LSGGLIALIGVLTGERKEREKAGARRIPRGCGGGRRAGGRRKGRGRREADRWAPAFSVSVEKEKGGERWAGAGGRLGRLGRKEPVLIFFPFPFSNFIFKSFFISNSIQTFSNFSQEFYRLFRNHTSNQKPCKPTDDAHTLVVSKFIKLSLIFLELNLNSNLISLNP
jgi:hypothetical protein